VDKAAVRKALWAAAPAVAALIVYAITLGSGFLYDDDTLIRTNRWVQDASVLAQLPFKPLLTAAPMGSTNYYRPVVNILYNLTWQLGGGRPGAFHLLNVLLHMLNATLVFLLMRRISGLPDATAAGAAILFAVHPLGSEVVAWPSCLPELAYSACGLSALLLQALAWSRKGRAALACRAGSFVLFGLALACKETALAFLPLAFAMELWLRPDGARPVAPRAFAAARSLVPYLVAAALFFAARTSVLGGLIPRGAHGTRTIADVVLNAPWLLALYIKAMLVPSPLLVEHVIPLVKSAANLRFLAGVVVVAAVAVGIVRLTRRAPGLAFAACLAVLPVLPALYIPALGRDPFAERYAYLGIAGFCWLVVGGASTLVRSGRLALPAWALPSLLVALTVAAGARTAARCTDWRDDETLGSASMRDEPAAPIGYLLVGNWHLREGRKDEALRIFNDGMNRLPESVELQQNAIGLGLQLGRLTEDDAIAAYERLVPLASGSASAQFNLGHALLQKGRLAEAKTAFSRSLELSPSSVASMTALAVIASKEGDDASAVALCRRALAVDDHSTAALQQLGVALMRQGDMPGAVFALEHAVQLDASDKDILNRLGVAYARTGRLDDARRAWEKALAIDPAFEGARQNLDRLSRMPR